MKLRKLFCLLLAAAMLLSLLPAVSLTAAAEAAPLSMYYDDRLNAATLGTGLPQITDQTVTSYQVGTDAPDAAVLTYQEGQLIAVGCGTATVTFADATYSVTVSPAPISLFMVVGHSVGAGYLSDATGSVICEPGTAYSTHESYDPRQSIVPILSNLDVTGYGIGYGSVQRVPQIDAFSTTGVRAGDAAIAWRWHQITGEKAWVLNSAHSGSNIDKWVQGGVDYEHAYALFGNAKTVLANEQAAGHYVLRHTALFYHSCANGDQRFGYDEYSEKFASMWGGLKTGLGIEAMGLIPYTDKAYKNNVVATNGRQANFYMAASADYPDIFLASDDVMQFVSDGTIAPYVESNPITYTAHGGTPAAPQTLDDLIYDNCHLKAVGSNYIGIEIAENCYTYFCGGAAAQSVHLRDMSTKQMLSDTLSRLPMMPNETRYLAVYGDPNGVNNLTFETEGDVTWSYPGILTTGSTATGKLIVKQNGQVVRTLEICAATAYDLIHVVEDGVTTIDNFTPEDEEKITVNPDGSVQFTGTTARLDRRISLEMDKNWTLRFAFTKGSGTANRFLFGSTNQANGGGDRAAYLVIRGTGTTGELQIVDYSKYNADTGKREARYYKATNFPTGLDMSVEHQYELTNQNGVVSYSIDGVSYGAFTLYNVGVTNRDSTSAPRVDDNFNESFDLDYVSVKLPSGAISDFTLRNVNLTLEAEAQAAAPTASPAGGTYHEAQTVTLSSDIEGAQIFYTLDGSDPEEGGVLYTAPFLVSESCTLKAIAFLTDGRYSAVCTEDYVFTQSAYNYELVSVVTDEGTAVDDLTVLEGTAATKADGSVEFTSAVAQLESPVAFKMDKDWTISFAYQRGSATGTRYVFATDTQIKDLGAGRVFISVKNTGELQLSDLSTQYRYYMTEQENLPNDFDATDWHFYEITNRNGVVSYSIDGSVIGAFTHYNVRSNARKDLTKGSFNTDFSINYVGAKAYDGTASPAFTLSGVQFVPEEPERLVSSSGEVVLWQYRNGQITLSGELSEDAPVFIATYAENDTMIAVTKMTSGGTANVGTDFSCVKLFWLDADSAPKCENGLLKK